MHTSNSTSKKNSYITELTCQNWVPEICWLKYAPWAIKICYFTFDYNSSFIIYYWKTLKSDSWCYFPHRSDSMSGSIDDVDNKKCHWDGSQRAGSKVKGEIWYISFAKTTVHSSKCWQTWPRCVGHAQYTMKTFWKRWGRGKKAENRCETSLSSVHRYTAVPPTSSARQQGHRPLRSQRGREELEVLSQRPDSCEWEANSSPRERCRQGPTSCRTKIMHNKMASSQLSLPQAQLNLEASEMQCMYMSVKRMSATQLHVLMLKEPRCI